MLIRKMDSAIERFIKKKTGGIFSLCGIRNVGKTTMVLNLINKNADNVLYINFETDFDAFKFFTDELRYYDEKIDYFVLKLIAAYYQIDVMMLANFIIIFDEVKKVEGLHEFVQKSRFEIENSPIKLIEISSEDMTFKHRLYPISFDEYLMQTDKKWLVDVIRTHFLELRKMPEMLHDEIIGLFEEYLICGGMPQAVDAYLGKGTSHNVKTIQKNMIELILSEGSLYENVIFKLIPHELYNNDRFKFSDIRKGSTYNIYEEAINSLIQKGLINKYVRNDKDSKLIRLFYPDSGLLYSYLCASESKITEEWKKSGKIIRVLISNVLSWYFEEKRIKQYFWQSKGKAVIDCVAQLDGVGNTPIDIITKGEPYTKNTASYMENNEIRAAIKLSYKDSFKEGKVFTIPYYAYYCLEDFESVLINCGG